MRYAGLKKNDATNCDKGIVVSFWCQFCPHRCEGCHNPETWSAEGGYPLPADIKEQIIKAISANGVQRNFSVLGGEPLCPSNQKLVLEILKSVFSHYPKIKIFLWTGYTLEELEERATKDKEIKDILSLVTVLIDGRFEISQRDLTLALRGSRNQRIWEKNESGIWENRTSFYDNK
jgi:anaerobic ribonucleoside-triphosphate reductase activating protein